MQDTSRRFSAFQAFVSFFIISFACTSVVVAQPNVVGTWDDPVQLQVEGVHGNVLPSGEVLYLPHRLTQDGSTQSVIFDPDNPGTASYVTVPQNYFCGGHSLTADGKLFYNGGETIGTNFLRDVGYYDFKAGTWTEVEPMIRPRWYPSTIQMGDGKLWTFGGQNEPADPDTNDNTIEIYDPATNTWTMAGGQEIPGQYEEAYNRLHLLPDGKVFQSGHLPQTYLYDPVAKTFTFIDDTNLGLPRGNGSSVLLQDGRIMIIGGEDKIDYFNSAEIIDLTQPSPQWQNAANMNAVRAFINAIILPDGKVFVIGGDEGVGADRWTPELYDPAANTWTNMADFTIERGYHATALLLPDGRVIVSGGEGHGGPGVFGESAKYEIWNPYYLFQTARPTIQSFPSSAGYGQQLTMGYSSSVAASHVVIHRVGSQTHSFNYNQISHPVSFDSNDGSTATFTIPNNPNLLPPSYYMVFLMSSDGVPSVARWLKIGAGSNELFADGFESGTTAAWSAVVGGSFGTPAIEPPL